MAGGWSRDGAVQDQIDDTVKNAVRGARARMTDWHLMPLGQLALLTIEATAVLSEGRIIYADVGLWNDETEAAIGRVVESIRRWSDMPIAVQLAHAGRKGSTEKPWCCRRRWYS